jgi:WD40 repeat protein
MKGNLKSTIVQGHFTDVPAYAEVWGCTTHPTEQKFATCGSDRRIRVWEPKKMIAVSEKFNVDVTALDWSSDGTFIAVGDRKGFCTIVDAKTLQVLGTMKSKLSSGKQPWVEDIKVSPNNKLIAWGTHDGRSNLEIAEVKKSNPVGQQLVLYASCEVGLSSALTHLDWSQDSCMIQLNSQSYELLFFNVSDKA